MFSSIALAMGSAPGGAETGAAGLAANLFPIVMIIAVFYFILIRPQQKKQKQHQEMLHSLKKGDSIITNGGMYGRIVDFQDETVIVDLGEHKVFMLRNSLNVLPANQKSPIPPLRKDKKKSAPAEKETDKEVEQGEDAVENEE